MIAWRGCVLGDEVGRVGFGCVFLVITCHKYSNKMVLQ